MDPASDAPAGGSPVTRIIDIPPGTTATVIAISSDSVARLNRLASFGVIAGTEVRLLARRPSLVVACGETSIALEEEIGHEILVSF